MSNPLLSSTPTIYKWDRFWVGLIPAFILPLLGMCVVYGITALSAKFNYAQDFTPAMFLSSMRNAQTFMRVSTLSCFANAVLFFFLIQRNYYNASRGAIIATMVIIMGILAREVFMQ